MYFEGAAIKGSVSWINFANIVKAEEPETLITANADDPRGVARAVMVSVNSITAFPYLKELLFA
jgi:hypothetical protein